MVEESELKRCSYFLVRYVPDVAKGEFLNIGVFLSCPAEQFLDFAFSDDWRRVARFHAEADTEFLKELPSHFRHQIEEIKQQNGDLDDYLRQLQQSFSNLIQLSPPRTCLTVDLAALLLDLFNRYVGVHLALPADTGARKLIKRQMRASLGQEVLRHPYFRKDVPASQWTNPGDPFVFDFGYKLTELPGRPNGRVKLIHTLSLKTDPKLAKELRWTFDRVLEKERCHLTVGHEDKADPDDTSVRFSQSVLEHENIRLVPASGFAAYAQSVRAELLQ